MTLLEKRFKVAIFAAGDCDTNTVLPDADPMNFAPHVKIPLRLIAGRYDFVFPLDTCHEPLFRAPGTPGQAKSHALSDTGHAPLPVMKDTLNWLDQSFRTSGSNLPPSHGRAVGTFLSQACVQSCRANP